MSEFSKKEIEKEIQLAQMMTKDLKKLWSSYAKKALEAKTEREKKQVKRGFLDCETKEELIDLFGYGDIDEDTYHRGLDYFDTPIVVEISLVEQHRQNIKAIVQRFEGTAKELTEELYPTVKDKRTIFEKMDAAEREEKYKAMAY